MRSLPTPRLLDSPRVRRLLGLALTLQGVLGALAPRLAVELGARAWLREAYENPGDLEPTDAYVGLVRDASLATAVLGVLTLRRAARDEAARTAAELLDEGDDADATGADAAGDGGVDDHDADAGDRGE